MTRDQLKALIKECLIELLMNGLGQQIKTVNISGIQEHKQNIMETKKKFDPRLDTPIKQASQLKEAIKHASGNDPVMASIFADTAKTTLQSQMAAGDTAGTPTLGTSAPKLAQQEQFAGNPEDVFGECAAKWASLAFMDAPQRKTL